MVYVKEGCVCFEHLPDYLSGWRDSNPRPLRPERSALPGCATPRNIQQLFFEDDKNIIISLLYNAKKKLHLKQLFP